MRRDLPPHFELRTRPDGLNEIALPPAVDPATVNAWAGSTIETHRNRIDDAADPNRVERSFETFIARFDDAFVADVSNVLLWFSGKDILAGIAEWLSTKAFASPGAFRASQRDRIIANPEQVLELLSEWNSLTTVLGV